jgi:TonB-dependent receptor
MPLTSIRRALVALMIASPLLAQEPGTGRVVGKVIDAETGRPISEAGVQIVGTTLGGQTNIDGSYSISRVPEGNVTIQVRRLGYAPKTVTGLRLAATAVLEQDISLSVNVTRVDGVVVSATAERGSVENALDEQRTALGIVNSMTAEQISKSPDANAAQAIGRLSGVTVTDGKYVVVRGTPERYTTTSLNGARVPSPEPERKVVPLDLFPSGLIQSVTTSKTFTPDLSGDFSGAHVDIKTKEFPAERQVTYGFTTGSAVGTWGNQVAFAPGAGGEAFAWANGSRFMPAGAATAGDFSGTTQQQRNQIINSFRNVWRAGQRYARPNMSGRMSVGGSTPVMGRKLGYLISGSYSYSQDRQDGGSRALARYNGGGPETAYNQFTGDNSGTSVLMGGLLNLSTLLTPNSRLTFNNMYSRSADNDATVERGFLENEAIPVELQRLRYVERMVWSSQLSGETRKNQHAIDWSVTGSGVTRDEPDRSELGYELDSLGPVERKLWVYSNGDHASRTFATLDEKSIEAKASYSLEFGSAERRSTFKVGALGRGAHRDADVRTFGIYANSMSDSIRALPPEILFGGQFTHPDSSVLTMRSLSQGGAYTATDGVGAGFAMVEMPLTRTLRVITGVRYEHQQALVKSVSSLGDRDKANPAYDDFLPSLALNYRPTDRHAIRVSGSRTLARPEYREVAAIRTRDGNARVDQVGNSKLVRTLIDNADVRYEFYPRRGEVMSVAVFAKRFHKPIERVFVASSSAPTASVVNADGADNIGVELELRKELDQFGALLEPFTVFGGATFMQSQIRLGAQAASSTNPNRAMVGQSPYVVNAGLTWNGRAGASATLLFNRIGDRIVEAGQMPMPDVVELARNSVDASFRWPMRAGVVARIDAKNLTDDERLLKQGAVTREGYRTGRGLQIGVTLQR